jgi:predicted permease
MRDILIRIRSLFSRARLDDELREEIDGHIDLRRRALIEEGMDPREAACEARRAFGNPLRLREEAREMWRFRAVDAFMHDMRYGLRLLARAPMFTLVAVLSIAGGLVAAIGIFAFANAVALRPLGVGHGESLYRIYTADSRGGLYGGTSYLDFEEFAAAREVFAAVCATIDTRANVTVDSRTEVRPGEVVSAGCFDVFQLTPARGRFFSGADAAERGAPPVVISYALWHRLFAASPAAIGKTIALNGTAVTITAVAPRGFAGTSLDGSADFWIPVSGAASILPSGTLENRGARSFMVLARLRDGVPAKQADAALAVIAARLRRVDDRAWSDRRGETRRVTVARELDSRFATAGGSVYAGLAALVAAGGLIAAIACINVATMLLARGAGRSRELSLRLALGASRSRLLRQLATESLVVAILGAALAIGVLAAGLRLLTANWPDGVPAFDMALDWRVVTFAVLSAAGATVMFGVAPALHTIRLAIAEGVKGRLFNARIRRLRFGAREILIVLQVTASVALLLISTLFVRAFAGASKLSPGFDGSNVAVVSVDFESAGEAAALSLTEGILRAAAAAPGVERPAIAAMMPLSNSTTAFDARDEHGKSRTLFGNVVSGGYFETLRIPLRAGRDFDQRDGATGARAAIVSETLAAFFGGTPGALGRILTIDGRRVEIVGVVADTKYQKLTEKPMALIYLPATQVPLRRGLVHARVRGGGETLAALERAVRSVDARVAVGSAVPFSKMMELFTIGERATQWIGGAIGVLQLGLAMMALWGLVSYAVERRTAEMGIRVALGATAGSLVRLMVRPAASLILIGATFGTVAGVIAAQIIQSEAAGLAPIDVRLALPAAALFALIAMAAAWLPARRAGLADPAAALKRE